MKKKTVKAFVKPSCEKCDIFKSQYLPKIKEMVKVRTFDLTTADGLAESIYYNVQLTPTLILVDETDKVVVKYNSILEAMKDLEERSKAVNQVTHMEIQ